MSSNDRILPKCYWGIILSGDFNVSYGPEVSIIKGYQFLKPWKCEIFFYLERPKYSPWQVATKNFRVDQRLKFLISDENINKCQFSRPGWLKSFKIIFFWSFSVFLEVSLIWSRLLCVTCQPLVNRWKIWINSIFPQKCRQISRFWNQVH